MRQIPNPMPIVRGWKLIVFGESITFIGEYLTYIPIALQNEMLAKKSIVHLRGEIFLVKVSLRLPSASSHTDFKEA